MSEWISIKTALPASGARVIFSWLNVLGKRRTSMGFYAERLKMPAEDLWEDLDLCPEGLFDYAADDFDYECPYTPEGWYEAQAEGGSWEAIAGVTHWTPGPEHPKDD